MTPPLTQSPQVTPPQGVASPGLFSTAFTVATKEVTEAVRDRQTLIFTVLVPLALYPVMFWVMLQVLLIVQAQDARTAVAIGLAGDPGGVAVARIEAALTAEDSRRDTEENPGESTGESPPAPTHAVTTQRLDESLSRAALSALMVDPDTGRAPPQERAELDAILFFGPEGGAEVLYVSTRSNSRLAAERAEQRLEELGSKLRSEALLSEGLDPSSVAPFVIQATDLSREVDRGGMILSFVLPMMFVIMAVMGAFFPAVDITAGEKERRTAETTLLVPAPRSGVQLGKVLAVTLAAAVATTVNLIGMALAAKHLLPSLGPKAPSIQIPWFALLRALPLGLVFLLATSAVMVALASFAETFKQGQALLNSVMMVFIFPAIFAVMPGIELSMGLALVPVVQTVLGFKALIAPGGLSGHGLEFALIIVSQLIYAGLVLRLSLHLTTRESLATSSAKLGQIKDLIFSRGTPR